MLEMGIGFAAGILIGATGTGAGSLVTPLLILSGIRPGIAVGTGLGVLLTSKFAGTVAHHRLGHWPGPKAWVLVAGGAGGVALGWWAARGLLAMGSVQADFWLKRLLGGVLLAGALALYRNGWRRESGVLLEGQQKPATLLFAGLGVAAIVTLTSAGSGSLLVPLLALATPWGVPEIVATSNLFGGVVGALNVALLLETRQFDGRLFLFLLLGLVPGVVAGAWLSRRIERRWLVRGITIITACLGTRLLLG